MVAEKRGESADLCPAGEQLGCCVAAEAADIRAREGDAGKTEIAQLRDRHLQVRPQALVVARPDGAVFLRARIAGAGDDKRAFTGEGFHSLIGRLGHVVAVEIVRLGVGDGAVFVRKFHILRQLAVKARRFVHVVPDACDADIGERLVVFAPPLRKAGLPKSG